VGGVKVNRDKNEEIWLMGFIYINKVKQWNILQLF
jgi:hypothetical protein